MQISTCVINQARKPLRAFRLAVLFTLLPVVAACGNQETVSANERMAIADSLEALVRNAYDFSKPGVVNRLVALYPDSGRVISASAGRITARREILVEAIGGFWQRVGKNMQSPTFQIGSSYVDVITRNAAVTTFNYSIPHTTPAGAPHTVSGAWTALWRRENGRWRIVQEHLSDTPESAAPAPRADSTGTQASSHNMGTRAMPKGGRN